MTDEAAAVDMGQQLIDRSISVPISPAQVFSNADDAFYCLMEDDDTTALNIGDYVVCGTPKQGRLTRQRSTANPRLCNIFNCVSQLTYQCSTAKPRLCNVLIVLPGSLTNVLQQNHVCVMF